MIGISLNDWQPVTEWPPKGIFNMCQNGASKKIEATKACISLEETLSSVSPDWPSLLMEEFIWWQ